MGLVALIILLVAIAILLRVDFIFYIAYVCIGVLVLSRWYAPRAMKMLRMDRQFTPNAFLGELVPVTLTWRNRSRLPIPWLEFKESLPLELQREQPLNQAISIAGKQSRTFNYTSYVVATLLFLAISIPLTRFVDWYTARDRDSGKIVSQSRDRSYVVDRAKEKTGNK